MRWNDWNYAFIRRIYIFFLLDIDSLKTFFKLKKKFSLHLNILPDEICILSLLFVQYIHLNFKWIIIWFEQDGAFRISVFTRKMFTSSLSNSSNNKTIIVILIIILIISIIISMNEEINFKRSKGYDNNFRSNVQKWIESTCFN